MSDFKFFSNKETKSDVEHKAVADLLERGRNLLQNLQTAVDLQKSHVKKQRENASPTTIDGQKAVPGSLTEEQKIKNFQVIQTHIEKQSLPAIGSLTEQITQSPHAEVTSNKFAK
jgi:hypothetical protein